jgi:hypothetical protein
MASEEQTASASASFVPGEGNIRQRTIRFGPVIVPVEAVDSVALTIRPRNMGLVIFTSVLIGAMAAAGVHGTNLDYIVSGTVFLIVVGAGVAIALRWPSKSVLAVGTRGGRTYYVVSGHKEFLIKLGELIRKKIDTNDPALAAEFSAEQNVIALGQPAPPAAPAAPAAPPRTLRRVGDA